MAALWWSISSMRGQQLKHVATAPCHQQSRGSTRLALSTVLSSFTFHGWHESKAQVDYRGCRCLTQDMPTRRPWDCAMTVNCPRRYEPILTFRARWIFRVIWEPRQPIGIAFFVPWDDCYLPSLLRGCHTKGHSQSRAESVEVASVLVTCAVKAGVGRTVWRKHGQHVWGRESGLGIHSQIMR